MTTTTRTRAALGLLGVALTGAALGLRPGPAAVPAATAVSAAQADDQPAVTVELEELPDLPDGSYRMVLTRDPFEPVVETEDAVADGAALGEASGATELVDISTDSAGFVQALIRVDGAVFTVRAGDVVAGGVEVLELNGECITLDDRGAVVTHCDTDASDHDDHDGDGDQPHATGSCTGQDEVVCDGRVVTLVDIVDDANATVRVDSVDYDVVEGSVFDEHFEVDAITDTCVTIEYEATAFTLCEERSSMK